MMTTRYTVREENIVKMNTDHLYIYLYEYTGSEVSWVPRSQDSLAPGRKAMDGDAAMIL